MRKPLAITGSLVVPCLFAVASPAYATCSTYPYSLTNGTTADATQVMANFNCAALTDSPSLTGIVTLLGTGSALRIGTTSVGFGSQEVLTSLTTTASPAGTFVGPGNGTPGPVVAVMGTQSSGHMIDFFSTVGSAVVGSVSYTTSGVAFNTTSDERLKNWNVTQRDYRSVIQGLWVGDFKWKETGKPDFGVRAQQAFPLFPVAIQKPVDESKQSWSADYSRFAPLAIWGVKDLYAKTAVQAHDITSTREDVAALRSEVAFLKKQNQNEAAEIGWLKASIRELQQSARVRTARN